MSPQPGKQETGQEDRIEPRTFYRVRCAECGDTYGDDDEYQATPEDAVEHVLERDWTRVEGRLLCWGCHPHDLSFHGRGQR